MSQYWLRTEASCYRFSVVAGNKGYSPRGLFVRVIEGVAGQEGYCSEDLF